MSDVILQREIPDGVPWRHPPAARLPGLSPLPIEQWLTRDDAFAAQMALRETLIASRHDDVIALLPSAEPAAQECLDTISRELDASYTSIETTVTRPDGATVHIDRGDPMATIGRLIQSDVCLMESGPNGYVLTGAVLCFPASWTLAEKIGKPLSAIHGPVQAYDDNLEKRVQRVFEAIRPGTVLARSNALIYADADLFAPRTEVDRRPYAGENFLRTERQTLRRLPNTGAVVFGIHTTVIAMASLPDADQRALRDAATA